MIDFSLQRLKTMVRKEFIQMIRDKGTFSMIIGLPLVQLVLFGYAINSNPKQLPTVLVNGEHTYLTRSFQAALQNTDYFKIIDNDVSQETGERLLATNKAQFVVTIPPGFTHDFVRGERPQLLITADATDPMAIANALSASNVLQFNLFKVELGHGLAYLSTSPPPYQLVVHAKYNPEGITQYQTVPGLIGVVLTMTMTMVTTIAITREHERGTMEGLLSTPVRPIEVMLGKVLPYVITGYLQQLFIILLAIMLFHIPIRGNFILLLIVTLPFILANLMVGIMVSTFAKNQLQATQMTMFYLLPSILLSGFVFPFYGMPYWAQWIGRCLPLTHFVVIIRGIMIKGNGADIIVHQVWPILLFVLVTLTIGLKRYRETLD